MISIKKSFLSVSAGAIFFILFASAQAQPQLVSSVYSDVGLVDVSASVENNTISGTYALQGRMGQQNHINVGVFVYDENNMLVDAVSVLQHASVREGEIKLGNFSYAIPGHLQGKHTFMLKAETASGLPLGTQMLAERELSGTGRTVNCSLTSTSTPTIICSSSVDTKISIAYGQGSVLEPSQSGEEKAVKKGGKVNFTPDLSPGRYAAHIKAGNESYALKFTMPGAFGSIDALNVSSVSEKVRAVAVVRAPHGSNVTFNLLSPSGESCASATVPVLGGAIAETLLSGTCKEGTVEAHLVGINGEKLDSMTEAFSVLSVSASSNPRSGEAAFYAVFGLAVLLLLAYWFIRTRSVQPVVAALFVFACLGVTQDAHAAGGVLYYNCGPPTDCPVDTQLYWEASVNKSSYIPGETITAYMYFSAVDNPQQLDNTCGQQACVSPTGRFATSLNQNTSMSADLFPDNYTWSYMRNSSTPVKSYNVAIPGTITPGTHNLWLNAGAGSYNPYVTTSIPIQVTSTPTVNVQFSLLEKMFKVFALSN